ncbi:MAG TPA: LysE family transporter [Legionellaceae bacterium]|nr:LysE family transporter [Legionellaceae bacterium]
MNNAFWYGITLALGLIVPLGAQNLFIFNQGACHRKFLQVTPSIITAFLCDLVLILLAVSGVSLIVMTIPWLKNVIFSLGILFLICMGRAIWNNGGTFAPIATALSTKSQIIFALSASLLNPHAILDTIGIIGTNALQFTGSSKIAFTAACIITSFIWFISLAFAGRVFQKLDPNGLGIIIMNKLSAVTMWLLAGYLILKLL